MTHTDTYPTSASVRHVLLVEDDPDVAVLMKRWMERAGPFKVEVEPDGLSANRALWHRPWSLVISDIHLPGMDGFDLLDRFRRADGRTPFLLVSGRRSNDEAHRAIRLRATDFLLKPLEESSFVSCAAELANSWDSAESKTLARHRLRKTTDTLASQLASSMTLVAGVADLLADTPADTTAGLSQMHQYSGLLNSAMTQLWTVLGGLGALSRGEHDLHPSELSDIIKQAGFIAEPRLARSGVTFSSSLAGNHVVGSATSDLRSVIGSILVGIAENARLYGVHRVDLLSATEPDILYLDIRVTTSTGTGATSGLEVLLQVLTAEAIARGVPCEVLARPECGLRLTIPCLAARP